jgi:hypothetical protein
MGEAVKKARLAEMENETLSNMPFTKTALANMREAEGTSASARLSNEGGGKVVRLMNDEGFQPAPREEEVTATRQEADEAVKTQQALSAQMQSITAMVSALESTI